MVLGSNPSTLNGVMTIRENTFSILFIGAAMRMYSSFTT
jgi:hypothetical protein